MHRGSLQYWQKRRAQRRLPRARSSPKNSKEQVPLNFLAYKVGMMHLGMLDDSESTYKNTEVNMACTILEVPRMEVYGARFYSNDTNNYKKAALEVHYKDIATKFGEKKMKNDESKLNGLKERLNEFSDMTALIVAYPKGLSVEQHHPMRFESAIGGTIGEKFNFIATKIGKEVKLADVLKNGEFVDVTSITKGKGWQGPIKRFGTARLYHKATNKVRHIGTLGPFTPGKVLYTVPQAGQLGFNYRTESNKRVLKLGIASEANSITPKAGFSNYGMIRNDYLILRGSIPGPAKRLVRVRKSVSRNARGIKEPKITYTSINS
jgi:large subunit ribosomal protein L3